jgi:transketolase
MVEIKLIPREELQRVQDASIDKYDKMELIADMCRFNTLAAVKKAGSGHLGSSFSAMDIVVWLYYQEMNTLSEGLESPHRDIYFSSKGHDVPGFYSVLFALGVLSEEKLLKLRRLGGLDGHPNMGIPGVEANSGSLGMGISKGRGMSWAKNYKTSKGRVYVLTGDGEFQEGQNYEALQTVIQQKVYNLNVIIDFNKLQTDKLVQEITDLGDIEAKLHAFGWHVARCDGHDFRQLEKVLEEFKSVTDKPKILIADTIKGCGVSFMEHSKALKDGGGLYRWHSGAPNDEDFLVASEEIVARVNGHLTQLGLESVTLKEVTASPKEGSTAKKEYVAEAYGKALIEIAVQRKDLVVLDGDLAADCRVREFEMTYPDRFIENGIAEQDMVSMAGGLASQGLLPVVNSFACFLASRANEQIYNNATEGTKIIYACHYAGLIPAGPGKSHQSLRDISLFGALPNCIILQPCNALETHMIVDYCVNHTSDNSMLRLVIGPSPRILELPSNYQLTIGQGVALTEGRNGIMFAYGPVMLHEALVASELLKEKGFELQVINMPWLNRVDKTWLQEVITPHSQIFVLEDHSSFGGLGDYLVGVMANLELFKNRQFCKFAVEEYPACGTPFETLRYHKLDGFSLAQQILGEDRISDDVMIDKTIYTAEAPQ